jgi:hypothetical protein
MGSTPVRAAPQGVAVGYDILGYQPKARRCTETKLFPPATSGRAFHRKSVLKREKEKARPGHDLASWANLLGLNYRAPDLLPRWRWRWGHNLLVLRASTKSQSGDQNSHDHDRFQKFQSISPPFVAGCSGPV